MVGMLKKSSLNVQSGRRSKPVLHDAIEKLKTATVDTAQDTYLCYLQCLRDSYESGYVSLYGSENLSKDYAFLSVQVCLQVVSHNFFVHTFPAKTRVGVLG